MLKPFVLALLVVPFASGGGVPVVHSIREEIEARYELSLELGQPAHVTVRLQVTGLSLQRETLDLDMLEGFAFASLPDPLLGGALEVRAGKRLLDVERIAPYVWRVATDGKPGIEVRYSLPLLYWEQPGIAGRDEYEYPYVDEDHGMLATGALLVAPNHGKVSANSIRFVLPEGWQVLAPWPRDADGVFSPGEALWNDLVAVGAWDVREISVGDFVATVAVAPDQDGLLDAVAVPIEAIVTAELRLFGRESSGAYLFLFCRAPVQGFAGSPKTTSMTLAVSPAARSAAGRYVPHLIAHEFFHTWAASSLEFEDELRWVSEGITDYYAYLIGARLGLATWSEFADTLAEKLRATVESPIFGVGSLTASGGDAFFRGEDEYRLVYDGGLVIGAWLDLALRRDHGISLEAVLRDFINDPRWERATERATLNDFLACVAEHSSRELSLRLMELVSKPLQIDPVALFGELGVQVDREQRPPSLDPRMNLLDVCVVGIDPYGLAGRLGIRKGDCFLRINGVEVSSAAEVQAAWRHPEADRIQLEFVRAGTTLTLDEPLADEAHFEVPAEAWKEM